MYYHVCVTFMFICSKNVSHFREDTKHPGSLCLDSAWTSSRTQDYASQVWGHKEESADLCVYQVWGHRAEGTDPCASRSSLELWGRRRKKKGMEGMEGKKAHRKEEARLLSFYLSAGNSAELSPSNTIGKHFD